MSKKVDDMLTIVDSLTMNKARYDYIEPMHHLEYDDIVDDSDFKPTAERIRDNDFRGGASGATDEGLYDYDANKSITEKVSDVELLLRNGKLDKADVQKISESLDEVLGEQAKKTREKQIIDAEMKAQKNRTKALDEALGVSTLDSGKVSS